MKKKKNKFKFPLTKYCLFVQEQITLNNTNPLTSYYS